MLKNLSNILITELSMNVDFSQRLRDNFKSGVDRIPESFIYHISNKYSIPLDSLRVQQKEIVNFLKPMYSDVLTTTAYKKSIEKTPNKRKDFNSIPLAIFEY